MASKRKAFFSRSVSLSLAALLVLTGAMFLITTLEQDHQEWVLVEDQIFADGGVCADITSAYQDSPANYVFSFDEETSTYNVEVSGGDKGTTSRFTNVLFALNDGFDSSKSYKIAFHSLNGFYAFKYYTVVNSASYGYDLFDLRNVVSSDGVYSAEAVLYDQYVTNLSYKTGFYIISYDSANSSTFDDLDLYVQVYELQDDNAGSIAAAITGLTLIVMGVFATPMLNVFRRR